MFITNVNKILSLCVHYKFANFNSRSVLQVYEWVLGYQEGITGLQDLGACLVAAIKLLKADADSMMLDLAKSRLDKDLSKRRTLSDIPEIPSAIELSSESAGSSEKPKPERKSSAAKSPASRVSDSSLGVENNSFPPSVVETLEVLSNDTEAAAKNMQTLSLSEVIKLRVG